jgi:hypothetical protein
VLVVYLVLDPALLLASIFLSVVFGVIYLIIVTVRHKALINVMADDHHSLPTSLARNITTRSALLAQTFLLSELV